LKLDFDRMSSRLKSRDLDVDYYSELLDALFARFVAYLPK